MNEYDKKDIEKLAHQEIRLGLKRMIWPLIQIAGTLYESSCDIPKDGEPFSIKTASDFLEPEVIKRISTINLYGKTHNDAYRETKFRGTWGCLIYNAAKNGSKQLETLRLSYIGFLKPKLSQLLFLLVKSDFLQQRLIRCDEFMEGNPRKENDEKTHILNFMHGPTELEYQNFFNLMQVILNELDWNKDIFGEEPLVTQHIEISIKETLTKA
jgi:hypothetical protein